LSEGDILYKSTVGHTDGAKNLKYIGNLKSFAQHFFSAKYKRKQLKFAYI
jgi:hypothetical protein